MKIGKKKIVKRKGVANNNNIKRKVLQCSQPWSAILSLCYIIFRVECKKMFYNVSLSVDHVLVSEEDETYVGHHMDQVGG